MGIKRIVVALLVITTPALLPGCAVLGVVGQVAQGVVAVLGAARAVGAVATAPLAGPVRASLSPMPLTPAPPASTPPLAPR